MLLESNAIASEWAICRVFLFGPRVMTYSLTGALNIIEHALSQAKLKSQHPQNKRDQQNKES